MIIEKLRAESGKEWDSYIEQHPASTCYHLRAWQRVAVNAYRIEAPYLIARDTPEGPLRGVLPLFTVRSKIRAHITNGLFGAYGEILADSEEYRRALIDHAVEIQRQSKINYLLFKTIGENFPNRPDFNENTPWVIATLGLLKDPEEMWTRLRDKIRNCVRKAKKFGLKPVFGAEGLEQFYEVLAINMHKKGAPIYGLKFMRELAAALDDKAEIITINDGETTVAGAFIIYFRNTAFIPFASALPTSLHMSPNNLLYWEIIRRSCNKGMTRLDFGRSLQGSGPLAFKLGWGAVVEAQPCFVRAIAPPKTNLLEKNSKTEWFVRQWRKVPRTISDRIGPWICSQIAGLL
jgi:FemAB-related protein (PEP-CTERM system-associated)